MKCSHATFCVTPSFPSFLRVLFQQGISFKVWILCALFQSCVSFCVHCRFLCSMFSLCEFLQFVVIIIKPFQHLMMILRLMEIV